MKVNFINNSYRRFYQIYKEELDEAFTRCMENGDFVLRDDVRAFEKNLCNYTGAKYAVAVNSGTDALRLSIEALKKINGWKDGDEIITVSHVFIAPIQEIIHARLKPILIDVDEKTCVMDQNKIKEAITDRTVAILPVHLSGAMVDMGYLKSFGLPIIEDACQALGSIQNKEMAGAIGDVGTYSFISPKMMGGWGDNGAIVTSRKDVYEMALLLRNHWNITQNALLGVEIPEPEVWDWGHNSRMDNIQAALLNVKFNLIDWIIEGRKLIAERYLDGLKGLPIILPSRKYEETWQEFIIRVEDRDAFKEYMDKCDIELLIRDTIPNHKLYKEIDCSLPVTEMLAKEQVRLPIYPELLPQEVDYINNNIKKFYANM